MIDTSLLVASVLSGDWLNGIPEIERLLEKLSSVSPKWVYLALAAGAAVENFFPPIPADTFVVFGAFLSVESKVTGAGVFLATWSTNTAGALLSYGVARRWGRGLLSTRLGKILLRPRQLERLAALYNAHGSVIVFFSRFLPAFRSLVPVFAGVSHLGFWRSALPVAMASAIWYGILVYAGTMLGHNWQVIVDALGNFNRVLLAIATLFGAVIAIVWWRTRHQSGERVGGEAGES